MLNQEKPTLKTVDNSSVFAYPCPTPSSVQSSTVFGPSLRTEGKQWNSLHHPDLPGGYLRDWFLFCLTWRSGGGRWHSLDISLQATKTSAGCWIQYSCRELQAHACLEQRIWSEEYNNTSKAPRRSKAGLFRLIKTFNSSPVC